MKRILLSCVALFLFVACDCVTNNDALNECNTVTGIDKCNCYSNFVDTHMYSTWRNFEEANLVLNLAIDCRLRRQAEKQ